MSVEEIVRTHFPGSYEEDAFVKRSALTLLQDHGFSADNTLACVGVCRDELCQSLTDKIRKMWGETYDLSGLAGMPWVGRTGYASARRHAPVVRNRHRYIFFIFTHIGVGPAGEIGLCPRQGRPGLVPTCGELSLILDELHNGNDPVPFDTEDIERCLVRERLKREPGVDENTGLIEFTKIAHRASLSDLENLASTVFNPETDDSAILSGVQIHGSDGVNFVWPGSSSVVIRGRRSEIWF